ncbi:hypothetical protein [Microbacterium sp. SA39]|uniref:hypothetical protein n=1 Tax=Microbacterium sp. SA39 TaxID=1263625 RepID=UPI00061E4774|nr:hypothetical protein [Microbacterium sp. SA39]KJQ56127.1 hypothetical protein RS85_00012 [Microbacterium sp. SA39]
MLGILTTTGRVLLRHWPALVAWYLAGVLVQYVVAQVAGFIGAYSATVGFLVLPIGILARLISLVAMFLVLRDGLRNLQEVAPLPESGVERRRTFLSALFAGILPFFAVYWAQGLLREDVNAYSARALEVRTGIIFTAGVNGEGPVSNQDTVLNLPFNVWTVAIIVLAFAGRWAWSKWSAKLSTWLTPVAVYFEVVWVFFSVILLGDLFDTIKAWVDSRVAMAFLEDVREGILDAVAPLRWLWEGIGWVLTEAGPVLVAPLAWLTIAGVVFGQAIVAEKLRLENQLISRFREHATVIPNPVVRRLKDLGEELGARFRPIGRAILLMWRAGPLLVASYALLYVAVKALESYLSFGITRLIGPHEFTTWAIAMPLVSVVPLLLIEPLRITVISGAYDETLARLRRRPHERTDAADVSAAESDLRAVGDAAGLLPSSADVVAAALVSAPPRDTVGGQGSSENLRKDPPAF